MTRPIASSSACASGAEGAAAAGGHRTRIDARDDRGVQAGRGDWRRCGHGADAIVLQAADDQRQLRAALHRSRRRLAGAAAALQRHDVYRRQPAARRGREVCASIRTSSGSRTPATTCCRLPTTCRERSRGSPCSLAPRRRCSRRRRSVSTVQCSRLQVWFRTCACSCSIDVKAGRMDEARAMQRRLLPLARSIGPVFGVPGLKAALDLVGLAGGTPAPPLRPSTAGRRRRDCARSWPRLAC